MRERSIEEYLGAIYVLMEEGRKAKTTEMAGYLNVKPASVTEMFEKLAKEGYVNYKPYQGVTLTKKGLKAARKIKRKHRLLEKFLVDKLRIKKEYVHEQACEMEHTLPDNVEEAINKILRKPRTCPDDEKPIPQK